MEAGQLVVGAVTVGIVIAYSIRARRAPRSKPLTVPSPKGASAPEHTDPEYRYVDAGLRVKDLRPLLAAMDGARAAGRWARRYDLGLRFIAAVPEPQLDARLAEAPGDSSAVFLHGLRKMQAARKTRGGGDASTVSPDAADRMEALAAEADTAFDRVASIDGADPTPWAARIHAAMLMQPDDTPAQCKGHFREAERRDPECVVAIQALLSAMAPHWFGNKGEGLTVARAIARDSAPGSVRPMAIFAAHEAEWHYRRFWGKPEAAAAYFRNPAVVTELRAAYQASMGSPGFQVPPEERYLPNLAAFCFYLAGDKGLVRREIARVGDRPFDAWGRLPGAKGKRAAFEAAAAWAST
jgi:hypothetical protein